MEPGARDEEVTSWCARRVNRSTVSVSESHPLRYSVAGEMRNMSLERPHGKVIASSPASGGATVRLEGEGGGGNRGAHDTNSVAVPTPERSGAEKSQCRFLTHFFEQMAMQGFIVGILWLSRVVSPWVPTSAGTNATVSWATASNSLGYYLSKIWRFRGGTGLGLSNNATRWSPYRAGERAYISQ